MSAYDNTPALSPGKVDIRPLSVPASKGVSATEWNNTQQAIADLRTALQGISPSQGVLSGVLPIPSIMQQTTGSMTLYVDVSGSDSNPGTRALPFATLDRAYAAAPHYVRHPLTISLGTGSFSGTLGPCGFVIAPATASLGAWLEIRGAMGNPSGLQGSVTGTVSSAQLGGDTIFSSFASWGFVTASANPNWAVNELRGLHVTIVSGTGVGQTRVIAQNDSNTFTIVGGWITALDATSAFEIQRPVTVIVSTTGSVPVNDDGLQIGSFAKCFTVFDNLSSHGFIANRQGGTIILSNMIFSGNIAGARGVSLGGSAGSVLVKNCVNGNAAVNMVENLGGFVKVEDCIVSGSVSNTFYRANSSDPTAGNVINCSTRRNFIYGVTIPYNVFGDVGKLAINAEYLLAPVAMGPYLQYSTTPFNPNAVTVGGCYLSGSGVGKIIGPNNPGVSFCSQLQSWAFTFSKVEGFTGPLFDIRGPSLLYTSSLTGSGNTSLYSLTKGAQALIDSSVSINGANTELSIDTTVVSLATMRAGGYATGSLQAVWNTKAYVPG